MFSSSCWSVCEFVCNGVSVAFIDRVFFKFDTKILPRPERNFVIRIDFKMVAVKSNMATVVVGYKQKLTIPCVGSKF